MTPRQQKGYFGYKFERLLKDDICFSMRANLASNSYLFLCVNGLGSLDAA